MIQTLTYEEQARLVMAMLDECSSSTGLHRLKVLRDHVLILLGLRCGFRVGECQKLRVSDVWENDHPLFRIHIPADFNKKNVEGWVRISPDLQDALAVFIPERLKFNDPAETDPILLPPRPGQAALSDRLSRAVVMDILEFWKKKAGIPHIHFHTLRHTFATNILKRGGGNLKEVQALLRHRHLSSTSVYLHTDQDSLDLAVLKGADQAPEPSP